ncbi:unnamed protein product [Peniophora sp. CBMAI 1063]|nr:unnamed protein product [Peniophora sp. CBMAI 1063]
MPDNPSLKSSLPSLLLPRFTDNALLGIPRELHLQTMDAELDVLELTLCRARQMRNRKSVVCNLPPEILIYVFANLQLIWRPRMKEYTASRRVYDLGWMYITQVCSLWREVAIGSPSLWSWSSFHVLDFPHQFISLILPRLRSKLLDIEIHWEGTTDDLMEDPGLDSWLSTALFRRARRINITGTPELIDAIGARLPPPEEMSSLRELEIFPWDYGDDIEIPAPLRLLSDVSTLSLNDCQVPWRSPIISPRLTHLQLVHRDGGSRSSYHDLRVALVSLDMLEELDIGKLSPFDSIGTDLPPIVLPQSLRRLILTIDDEEYPMEGLVFLSLLHPPSGCSCDYVIDGLPKETAVATRVDDILCQLLRLFTNLSLRNNEAQHWSLADSSMHLVSTRIQPSSPANGWEHWKTDPQTVTSSLRVYANMSGPGILSRSGLLSRFQNDSRKYMSSLDVGRLHSISLDTKFISLLAIHGLWLPLLESAQSIRRIGVVNVEEDSDSGPLPQLCLLDALQRTYTARPPETPRVLVPHLEVLALNLLQDEMQYSVLIASLLSLSQVRHQLGIPIRELVVPQEVRHWAVWSSLQGSVRVTFIEYPSRHSLASPVMPQPIPIR